MLDTFGNSFEQYSVEEEHCDSNNYGHNHGGSMQLMRPGAAVTSQHHSSHTDLLYKQPHHPSMQHHQSSYSIQKPSQGGWPAHQPHQSGGWPGPKPNHGGWSNQHHSSNHSGLSGPPGHHGHQSSTFTQNAHMSSPFVPSGMKVQEMKYGRTSQYCNDGPRYNTGYNNGYDKKTEWGVKSFEDDEENHF